MPTEPREIVAEVVLGVATAVPETDCSPDVALVKLKPVTRGMRTPATEPRVTVELVPVTVRFASAVTVGVFVDKSACSPVIASCILISGVIVPTAEVKLLPFTWCTFCTVNVFDSVIVALLPDTVIVTLAAAAPVSANDVAPNGTDPKNIIYPSSCRLVL